MSARPPSPAHTKKHHNTHLNRERERDRLTQKHRQRNCSTRRGNDYIICVYFFLLLVLWFIRGANFVHAWNWFDAKNIRNIITFTCHTNYHLVFSFRFDFPFFSLSLSLDLCAHEQERITTWKLFRWLKLVGLIIGIVKKERKKERKPKTLDILKSTSF